MEKKKTYQKPTMEVSEFRFTEHIASVSCGSGCPRDPSCTYWDPNATKCTFGTGQVGNIQKSIMATATVETTAATCKYDI